MRIIVIFGLSIVTNVQHNCHLYIIVRGKDVFFITQYINKDHCTVFETRGGHPQGL